MTVCSGSVSNVIWVLLGFATLRSMICRKNSPEVNQSQLIDLLARIFPRLALVRRNRPFPNCLVPLFQSETSCKNLSYENEFYLHFHVKRLCTKTRFQKEVQGNSKMAYLLSVLIG